MPQSGKRWSKSAPVVSSRVTVPLSVWVAQQTIILEGKRFKILLDGSIAISSIFHFQFAEPKMTQACISDVFRSHQNISASSNQATMLFVDKAPNPEAIKVCRRGKPRSFRVSDYVFGIQRFLCREDRAQSMRDRTLLMSEPWRRCKAWRPLIRTPRSPDNLHHACFWEPSRRPPDQFNHDPSINICKAMVHKFEQRSILVARRARPCTRWLPVQDRAIKRTRRWLCVLPLRL